MPDFSLTLKNSTDATWYFGVYQEYPSSPLENVVWKVKGVPPRGTNMIRWSEEYGIAIVSLDDSQIIGAQVRDGVLGKTYEVVSEGGVPSVNPNPTGPSGAGNIIALRNSTNPAARVNTGFSLSGDIIAVEKDVPGNATSEFQVHPAYWVDLYKSIQIGTFVTATTKTDPKKLEFPLGVFDMTAEAFLDGESINLKISQ